MLLVLVKRHMHTPLDKRRGKSLQYYLCVKRVCKNVFIKTLGISSSRLSYLIEKKSNSSVVSPDKRGRSAPGNKISDATLSTIKYFLNAIPKYISHYSISIRMYFHPTLTWKKMYEEYSLTNPNHSVSVYIQTGNREVQRSNMFAEKRHMLEVRYEQCKVKGETVSRGTLPDNERL